jgi:PKD repeat protein
VKFNAVVADADTFGWDFGDGSGADAVPNPIHIYKNYNTDYLVTLTAQGPGGQTTVTDTVRIPPMNKMEMLTGGPSDTDGKRWRLNPIEISKTLPDLQLTIDQTYPAGFLEALGFSNAYRHEFIFSYTGEYTIDQEGSGMTAGLSYCTKKGIPNVLPGQAAADANLTLMTPFSPSTGLTFGFNETKNFTLSVTGDGVTSSEITFNNVSTLTFSYGGFIGIYDFRTECILLEITENSLKLACFFSSLPASSPLAGITNYGLVLTFEPAD